MNRCVTNRLLGGPATRLPGFGVVHLAHVSEFLERTRVSDADPSTVT